MAAAYDKYSVSHAVFYCGGQQGNWQLLFIRKMLTIYRDHLQDNGRRNLHARKRKPQR